MHLTVALTEPFVEQITGTLGQCDTLSLFAKGLEGGDPTGAVPPYTMHLFAANGIASSQALGSNTTSLSLIMNYTTGKDVNIIDVIC